MKNGRLKIDEDGSRIWWKRGRWHRTDGPAAEFNRSGNKYWNLNGHSLSREEWEKECEKRNNEKRL